LLSKVGSARNTRSTARGEESAAEQLTARGLRATRQRIAVLEVLRRSAAHPTATQVYRQLLEKLPTISLKTVYDCLDVLVGAGLAGCLADGGTPYRYDANVAPHYHAQCRLCGALMDIPARADGQIRGRTPLPSGFELEQIRVTLVGRCSRCSDSA